ncbi:MAG TPA: HAD-IA family hydrolase [Candidatus Acidoferrales bacterium]|nr:HAD-IA family hydrolase [Candidatus Acidoferrales bacterium]
MNTGATANAARKRIPGVRVLIFDLDGTLIDSKLDLALSVNAALAELGRRPLPHEQIFGYVGQGAPMLIRRALGDAASEEECRRALDFFLQYYRAHMLDNTVTYAGVREGLRQLARFPMAVLTNKPVRFSGQILAGLGIADYFRYVYGGNSFERKKPDPMGVQILLRDFGVAPREALLIGDSEIDVQTARNADAWACGVTYGLGSARLTEFPPDILIDTLAELPGYLSDHLPDSGGA